MQQAPQHTGAVLDKTTEPKNRTIELLALNANVWKFVATEGEVVRKGMIAAILKEKKMIMEIIGLIKDSLEVLSRSHCLYN